MTVLGEALAADARRRVGQNRYKGYHGAAPAPQGVACAATGGLPPGQFVLVKITWSVEPQEPARQARFTLRRRRRRARAELPAGVRPSRPLSSSSSDMRSVVTSVSSASTPVPRRSDQRHGLGFRLVDLDIFLQGVDEFLLKVLGRNGFFSDFPQRHDRVFIVVALDRDLRARRDHARAVGGQKDEVEPVLDLVDAIFNGNSGHFARFLRALRRSRNGTLSAIWRLRIVPGRQAQVRFLLVISSPIAASETATRRRYLTWRSDAALLPKISGTALRSSESSLRKCRDGVPQGVRRTAACHGSIRR